MNMLKTDYFIKNSLFFIKKWRRTSRESATENEKRKKKVANVEGLQEKVQRKMRKERKKVANGEELQEKVQRKMRKERKKLQMEKGFKRKCNGK